MKELIFWIDNKALAGINLLVKRFNWITGKDGIWLAYRIGFLPGTLLVMTVYERGDDWLAMFLAIKMFADIPGIIWLMDHQQKVEQWMGAKELEFDEAKRGMRICMFGMTVATLFLGFATIFLNYQYGFHLEQHWRSMLLFGSLALVWYLISIEKPPFSRSMAWQSLKQLLTIRQPMPATIPV